jgi:hypothetical protein
MKNKYLSILAILILTLGACTEDFLDRTPSDQISTAIFFTQAKDLEFALNGVYEAIGFNDWGDFERYGYSTTLLRLECVTDNGYDGHSWNELYEIAIGTANAYDPFVTFYWKARYRGIQRANRMFEGVGGIKDINPQYRDLLMAQARFLRAYFYFDLVYLWGDVPYLTHSVSPNDAVGLKRTDKKVVLDSIVHELDLAAAHLPLSYDDANLGRVTKGAAMAFKSRVLLYMEKWAEAAEAAQQVMDLQQYQLYDDYAKMFSYDGINNVEVIFDLQELPDQSRLYNFNLANYGPNSAYGWSSGTPLQSLVDAYECTDGLPIDQSPLYDPTSPWDNRDPRLEATIIYPGRPWLGGSFNSIPKVDTTLMKGGPIVPGDNLLDGTGGQWNKTFTGYNWAKYMDEGADYINDNLWNGSIHMILIRYAEVLLNYAEAKIEANDIDQSVYDAINAVRARVNMPPIPGGLSQAELRERVRHERRVELAFESLRLLDIRRWKIAEHVMPGQPKLLRYSDPDGDGFTRPTDDPDGKPILSIETRYFDPAKDYLWPIPQAEIDNSKIEQNPGW